jgi:hypothetical protein
LQNVIPVARCIKQLSLSSPCTHTSTCKSRDASLFLHAASQNCDVPPPRFRGAHFFRLRHPNPPERVRAS